MSKLEDILVEAYPDGKQIGYNKSSKWLKQQIKDLMLEIIDASQSNTFVVRNGKPYDYIPKDILKKKVEEL